jgi:hypothetical protein
MDFLAITYYQFHKRIYFTLIVFCFGQLLWGQSSSSVEVTNVDFKLVENRIYIQYDLIDTVRSSKAYIELDIVNASGAKLNIKTVSGDVNRIVEPGNNKLIIWDIKKDYPEFKGNISVTVSAIQYIIPKLHKQLLHSTLLPGLGNYKVSNNKSWLIIGVVGYGLLGASITYEFLALKEYKLYEKATTTSKRNSFYNHAILYRETSNYLMISAAAVWTINYGLTYLNYRKSKNTYLNKVGEGLSLEIYPAISPALAISYSYRF